MRVSKKRIQSIYNAATEPIMDARVRIAKLINDSGLGCEVDMILCNAMNKAGDEAVNAATRNETPFGP